MKSKRRDTNWGCIVAIALFICGCALPYGFLKLTWGNSYTVCFGTPFPSYQDLQQEAFFELPSSARNLAYDANGLNRKGGCTIWVKFEIDPGDLEDLQNSTLIESFKGIQLDGDAFLYFLQRKDWAQPNNSIAGVGYNNDYPYTSQWVFIDMTDESNFIVYIITNQEWL
jgi:hypothetical protein